MARITGERVALREFRQEDISGIRSWATDVETTRTLGGAYLKPQTWEQSERYLSNLLNGDAGGVNLVIADRESLRYLGQCSLMMVDNVARHAELAVVMCPVCQNQGLGQEGVRLMLGFAFRQMNLNRVHLKVRADNARAIRCYEKCGFVKEGTLRAHAWDDGEYRDVVVMGVLREEFYAESPKK
ncbi:MAG: GNAT family N-acetyltransferase [Clostridia bacterium]|nr:GNAT family N-acetyltransferase [Clostridia bacterium]